MASSGWPSPWRPNSSRLLTTPSLLAPMSTRISSLSMRTTWPSTTSPCLKLLMSESCSASSSSIVVGSGPSGRAGAGSSSSSLAAGASAVSSSVSVSSAGRRPPSLPDGPARSSSAAGAAGSGSRVGAAAARRRRASRLGIGLWLRPLPARSAARSSVLVAGSSATATAATLSSDAWSAAEAMASGSGVVPPCWFRSRVWSLLVVDLRPRITNGLSDAQAVSETIEVVRGDRLRGPLLRASNGSMSLVRCPCPLGPGESSTRLPTATIAAPCPNCPI